MTLEASANLSMLFREVPLLERPAAAAAAGFTAVECWWPFDGPDPSADEIDAFVRAVTDAGVTLAAMNLDAGDMPAGERGFASVPAATERFRAGIRPALEVAERLGCTVLHALYGNRVPGVDPRVQDDLAVEHLALAANAAADIGAVIVVEALNPWENPLYPITGSRAALEVIARVAAETGARLQLLYDLYHMQRSEGDLITSIRRHAARFGHVQLADAPGRHEPGTGEVAFDRVLAELEAAGYRGRVGMEYVPSTSTEASLGALRQLGLLA